MIQSGNGTMNDPFNGNQDPENNNNWEVYNFDLFVQVKKSNDSYKLLKGK